MALFLQYTLGDGSVQPRSPLFPPVLIPVHPRSLQAAADLCSLLELYFLEDPPPCVPLPDKDCVSG